MELLVVVAVVAVLLAMALPALSRARSSARESRSAVNAKSLSTIIQMHADANREVFPAIEPAVLYPASSSDFFVSFPYWYSYNAWTGVVYDAIPYPENLDVLLSPGSPRRRQTSVQWPTSYHYSTSFVGDPQIWAIGGTATDQMERPVRTSHVVTPSRKALLWDQERAFSGVPAPSDKGDLDLPTPIAFADVSVRMLTPSVASPPVPNTRGGPVNAMRLHNTRDGVRGADY